MRLSLRQKLLLFAVAIAILPLIVAGRTMIRIAQDELKSSANEQLVATSQQLVKEINDLHERTWLAPLVLIRNALDDPQLGVEEKISLLTLGIADIPDIVALQVTAEGAALPLVVVKDDFAARLKGAGLDPLEVLRVPAAWSGPCATAAAPRWPKCATFRKPTTGSRRWSCRCSRCSAKARPRSPRASTSTSCASTIQAHPFTRTGFITIVDAAGKGFRSGRRPTSPSIRSWPRRWACLARARG